MGGKDSKAIMGWWVPPLALCAGVALLFVRPFLVPPHGQVGTASFEVWPRAIGIIIIANVVGCMATVLLARVLVPWLRLPEDPPESFRAAVLLMVAEGTLYPLALLHGVKELVAVWLGFKAVSVWKGHAETAETEKRSEPSATEGPLQARKRYNLYLFNNAFRLGVGVLTYRVIVLTCP